jgi:putative transposase
MGHAVACPGSPFWRNIMSATIVLDRQLVVRFGQITYQFHSMHNDRARVQLMNQETGEILNMDMVEFCSKLRLGVFVVVGNRDKAIFGPKGFPNAVVVDVASLKHKAREALELRDAFLRYARRAQVSRGQRTKIEELIPKFLEGYNAQRQEKGKEPIPPFSASTAMDWMRRYECSGKNIAALLSGNHFRRINTRLSTLVEEVFDQVLNEIYLQRNRPTLKYSFDEVGKRLKKLIAEKRLTERQATCSYSTFQRREKELDRYVVLKRRYGSDYAKRQLRYTINGTQIFRALARLEIDHTMLNWVVVCDVTGIPLGRPTLTVIVDTFSGYIVGLYVSFNGPGVASVLKAIKIAIRPKGDLTSAAGTVNPWIAFGIGDSFLLDNGMEFHSKSFQLAAWELGVDLEYCAVRTPWLKPHVERCFANFDFLPVAQGRVFKPMPGLKNIDPKEDAVITLSALCRGLVIFAADYHAFQPNRHKLTRPYDLFKESIESSPPPRVLITDRGLDLIASISKERKVSHGGVEWKGLSYAGPNHAELIKAAGGPFSTMTKMDPDDIGTMHVRHPRTEEWVPLFCTWASHANNLTVHQHGLIRNTLLKTLKEKNSEEGLIRARDMLMEAWLEPLARKNAPIDKEQAKKYARFLASAKGALDPIDASAVPASAMLTKEDLKVESAEVPDFETLMFA